MRTLAERAGIDREREGAAFAQFADDADIAAECPGQAFGDGQPQARAAVAAAGGPIHLHERPEEFVDLLGGDADAGVRDRELHAGGTVVIRAGSGRRCGPRRAR